MTFFLNIERINSSCMSEKITQDPSNQTPKEHTSKETTDYNNRINDPIKHYIKQIAMSDITPKAPVSEESSSDTNKSENVNPKNIVNYTSRRYEKLKFVNFVLIIKEVMTKLSTVDIVLIKSNWDRSLFFETNKNILLTKMNDLREKSSLTSPSLLTKLEAILKNLPIIGKSIPGSKMSSPAAGAGSRAMKYPYTYTAKITQFPFKFYIKNNWMWRYYFIAVGLTFPVFWKIGRMSNSPENVKKWEEIRKRDFSGHH